jgi:hypothetical protein
MQDRTSKSWPRSFPHDHSPRSHCQSTGKHHPVAAMVHPLTPAALDCSGRAWQRPDATFLDHDLPGLASASSSPGQEPGAREGKHGLPIHIWCSGASAQWAACPLCICSPGGPVRGPSPDGPSAIAMRPSLQQSSGRWSAVRLSAPPKGPKRCVTSLGHPESGEEDLVPHLLLTRPALLFLK